MTYDSILVVHGLGGVGPGGEPELGVGVHGEEELSSVAQAAEQELRHGLGLWLREGAGTGVRVAARVVTGAPRKQVRLAI